MKKIILILFLVGFQLNLIAQDDIKSAVAKMNQCISGFSADQAQPLNFFAISGMLEQKQANLIQRISIAAINKIQVEPSKLGYTVTMTCPEGEGCVNIVKSDMSTSTMSSTTFFFTNPAAANTFASQGQKLSMKARRTDLAGELLLYKDANGQTPLMEEKAISTPVVQEPKISSEPQAIPATNASISKPKEKTIRELQEEEELDGEEGS